ncbi:hypothetical protein [Solemya velesiana gill symbiont]|uniref:Uncharacterized protein n=1 Tax=Solemya velesiana gill symbiont TaxID=1918948 RepID=A0A1T2KS32_9GAMM|nr:hypothetical protein [Solemya velesiana gill symbiont]OOZ35674.1 hypothetical protein BOW51_10895 [Solemya velesiana gill symbiont]
MKYAVIKDQYFQTASALAIRVLYLPEAYLSALSATYKNTQQDEYVITQILFPIVTVDLPGALALQITGFGKSYTIHLEF